ncbi:hypothetical protein B0H14DRAFT_2655024 [Mycena olivaceomarginata]|nr:hypothetical protein B0H14DRAFT_2655024 [Mycena olivaceomarginata]
MTQFLQEGRSVSELTNCSQEGLSVIESLLVGQNCVKLDRDDWAMQPWYRSFIQVLQLLREPRAVELLPYSSASATSTFDDVLPTIYQDRVLNVMVDNQNNVPGDRATPAGNQSTDNLSAYSIHSDSIRGVCGRGVGSLGGSRGASNLDSEGMPPEESTPDANSDTANNSTDNVSAHSINSDHDANQESSEQGIESLGDSQSQTFNLDSGGLPLHNEESTGSEDLDFSEEDGTVSDIMNAGAMSTSPGMTIQQMQKMIEQEHTRNPVQAKLLSIPVWQGVITWQGINPTGELHEKTWPSGLTLMVAEKPAVSLPTLQMWMKHVEPVVCPFNANPLAKNSMHNEMAYKSFVVVLVSKNIYFTASWTLPNGKHSANVLVMPVHQMGLVGMFFPLTGIPDMPQKLLGNPGPSIIPNPTPPDPAGVQLPLLQSQTPPQLTAASGLQLMARINNYMEQNGVALPQSFLVQLAKLSPVEQQQRMLKMIQAGQEQMRRRMVAAATAGEGLNPNNVQGGMGMAQIQQQQQQQQQQQHQHQHQQQQQQQQHQLYMSSGFNPVQFGLGGGTGSDSGMGRGMGRGMGGMGDGSSGMYPDILGAGLLQTVSGGGGGAGSYQMMQSFMTRNQDNTEN